MRYRIVCTILACLALTACGVRGALEPPPSATTPEGQPVQEQPVEDRPFILDGLLL